MDKYLQGLFILANDPVAEVRKLVRFLFKLLSCFLVLLTNFSSMCEERVILVLNSCFLKLTYDSISFLSHFGSAYVSVIMSLLLLKRSVLRLCI